MKRYHFYIACEPTVDVLPTLDQLERIRQDVGLPDDAVTYAPFGNEDVGGLVKHHHGKWCHVIPGWPAAGLVPLPFLLCDEVHVHLDGTAEQIAGWKAALHAAGWRDNPNLKSKYALML